MMASIAPIWDGNETWLVLGGGGLLAAFPLAYATLLPALYLPIMVMLFGLIFRGVAFEFRHGAGPRVWLWDLAFAGGSIVATFAQGLVLGAFITGFTLEDGQVAGGPFLLADPVQPDGRRLPGRRLRPARRHLADHEDRGRGAGAGLRPGVHAGHPGRGGHGR